MCGGLKTLQEGEQAAGECALHGAHAALLQGVLVCVTGLFSWLLSVHVRALAAFPAAVGTPAPPPTPHLLEHGALLFRHTG